MKKFLKLAVVAFVGAVFTQATAATWTATRIDGSSSVVRTDGTLKYAYTAASSTLTVNGVAFAPWGETPNCANASIAAPQDAFLARKNDGNNEGVAGDFGTMLQSAYWYNKLGDYTLTFNNLVVGRQYLAQIIVHYHNGRPQLTVKGTSPEVWVKPYGFEAGQTWDYGGSLVCVFDATSTSQSFTLTYSVDTPCTFNAIQLRDLTGGESGGETGGESGGESGGEEPGGESGGEEPGGESGGESGGTSGGGTQFEMGWTAVAMDASGNAVCTDGELVCAYARKYGSISSIQVHGVAFKTLSDEGDFKQDSKNPDVKFSPEFTSWTDGLGAEGASGDYATMLSNGFLSWGGNGNLTCTLKNLEPNQSYLVQFIVHRTGQSYAVTAPDGNAIHVGGSDWTYGGSLIGVFTSTGTSQSFTLNYGGNHVLNAVQVRKVAGVTPKVSDPSVGSASVSVSGKKATISLSGVTMGTDAEGAAATSYSVSCALNGAAAVTCLEGQSAETASFSLTDLADGTYTAVVTITTDKGKTSVAKIVDFTIDTAPRPVAPAIGSVKAAVSGMKATVRISDIVMGTNVSGTEAAESYTLSYTLNGATTVVASGLTDATASFVLADLAEGSYTCGVKITTDKGREVTESVTFKIASMPLGTDPLKISEICPRPDALDPNGKESGWVELWNCSESDIDLCDYEIVRANRGKELKPSGRRLASRIVPAGGYTVVYMSEEYDNADSGETAVYANDVMVCPKKISPKKFPLVALYKGTTLLEQFIVPVDLPDNQSFAPAGGDFPAYAGTAGGSALTDKLQIGDAAAVTRVILPTITPGAANDRTGEVAYGPNAGPLYGIKHGASDWKAFPLAKVSEPYPVSLAVNPLSAAEGDEIVSVKLIYRIDYARGDLYETEKYGTVEMTKGELDAEQGQLWTASIPTKAENDSQNLLTFQAGHLLRWAAQVTDKAGNTWRTPSFRNPDDGYEWYGTLIEPTADQLSATLPTWHLFVSRAGRDDMNWQYDSIVNMYPGRWPYGVRCGIFDSQTSNYYDNVKIDVRGNTTVDIVGTAGGRKYSHGLRFSKVHPMQCTDPFSGEKITVRKTSLLAELQDPTNLRSDLSMYLRRQAGQEVPFGYPVRVQLNGDFYQLDQHTNRFTDEYLTDYLGYDEYGCAFKNVGTVGGDKNTGGNPTQVLPDDDSDVMPELESFKQLLCGSYQQQVRNTGRLADGSTNAVARLYDLPAWFNFLALSRITQECDDDTSTLNLYYDRNGTGTWRPLAYDLHQSFGVYWAGTDVNQNKNGLSATDDSMKSHPYHGGLHAPESLNMGNRAYEGIYQTPKFRRLLVRRLRTLMDSILKEPGTPKSETPFWTDYVMPMYEAMKADSLLDRSRYPVEKKYPIYVWSQKTMPFEEGLDDLWDNYIVPRRTHFYVTHSITNTAKALGYGTNLNAGIPLAQSPLAALKNGFSVEAVEGGVIVRNRNAETVDMSGWQLTGPLDYTFPAGSVIDQAFGDTPGEILVVADRKAYIQAHGAELTDEVILGNANEGSSLVYGLANAEGETVIAGAVAPVSDGYTFFFAGDYTGIQTVAPTGSECRVVFESANIPDGFVLPAGVEAVFAPTNGTTSTFGSIKGAADSKLKIHGDGIVSVSGADTIVAVSNLVVKSGTFQVHSTGVAADKTPVINVTGHVKQSGGTIDLWVGTGTSVQSYGIFLANKDPKDAAGKAKGEVYAEFGGGTFNARVAGERSSAVYVDKGSVVATFLEGETVNAELYGTEPRFISTAGNVKFNGADFNVTGSETAAMGRVFKSDKKITVNGGHFIVNVPGAGTEIFSTSDNGKGDESAIKIDGGTFELLSDDDCFNADHHITVNGGLIYAVSLSNDVFDSNGDMTVNGGTILAYATAAGHEGLDVDPELTADFGIAHVLYVNGGTIFATGGSGAQWPENMTAGAGVNVSPMTNRGASQYTEKYLSMAGASGVTYTAKLPAMQGSCAILVTCPGGDGTHTLSGSAPTSGSMDFHELYITSAVETNQSELRVLEVYGSTTGTGDEGEYIVLTNVSAKVVQLEGFKLTSAKDDGKSAPKVNLTLGAGTVAPHGTVTLRQADYTGIGWEKITNGKIVIQLMTSAKVEVQTAHGNFGLFETTDGAGDSLVAKRFDGNLAATTDDWRASSDVEDGPDTPAPAPVIGGSSAAMEVSSTGVSFSVSNAVRGHRYYCKCADTLMGLKDASPVFYATAESDGELVFQFARDGGKPAQFYQIVVE